MDLGWSRHKAPYGEVEGAWMMKLAAFTGPKAFGRAYRIMLENDAHAPASADRGDHGEHDPTL